MEGDIIEGENPVGDPGVVPKRRWPIDESGCLGLQPKEGGRSHPKLNKSGRPIAKKYSDGKVKRTLKRRSKVLETVKRETNGTSEGALGLFNRQALRQGVYMEVLWATRTFFLFNAGRTIQSEELVNVGSEGRRKFQGKVGRAPLLRGASDRYSPGHLRHPGPRKKTRAISAGNPRGPANSGIVHLLA